MRLTRSLAVLALIAAAAAPAPNVVFDVRMTDLKPRATNRVVGDLLEAWFEGHDKTALSDVIVLPGHRTEAYLTVVIKLSADWTAPGGKLPGLSNTGNTNGKGEPCVVNGVALHASGWGGRRPDGCHWSARTQFLGYDRAGVGASTYIYALRPNNAKNSYGYHEYLAHSFPKGRWFAYVQQVKVNTPPRADGEITYWLVDEKLARGGKRVAHISHVEWRSVDVPQSAINEVWADIFCGGTNCGPQPWPRSTAWLKRLTVTDGLPDLAAVQAEVDRLNAASD